MIQLLHEGGRKILKLRKIKIKIKKEAQYNYITAFEKRKRKNICEKE